MTKRLLTTIIVLASLSFTLRGQTPDPKPILPAAKTYLDAAIEIIQANSLRKKSVDWNAVKQKALKAAAGAEVPVDTYDAIRLVLRDVKDSRSSLELTKELRDLEASRKP